MSKISLQPNSSGTGTFTLAAPDSNTNRTLTLPDEAGSVLTDVSNIESQVKTATNATGSAPIYACRAWVNFDGTGTVSIRASGNVSSITDNGTGDYTVNFATAMPDANYCINATSGDVFNSSAANSAFISDDPPPTTTQVRVLSTFSDRGGASTIFGKRDSEQMSVSIFR